MIHLAPLALSWFAGAVLLAADGRRRSVAIVAVCVLLSVLALDLVLLARSWALDGVALEVGTGRWPRGVGIRLRVDRMALLFGTLTATVLTAVLIHEASAVIRSRLLPAVLLLLCAGLHGAFFTGDLFNFYVFFELSMVASFALAAYGYGRAELRGTLTYVAVNLLGSAVFLVGVASLYHITGTLDAAQIAARASGPDRVSIVLAATLLFAALSLKLGLFPLHGWVPPLYGNARPAVAAAMAGALANIGAYGLLRLGTGALESAADRGRWALLVLGAAAILYGALLAFHRRRPPEIAAYASVVHAGYVVLALGIGGPHGIAALVTIVVAGSLDKTTMFLVLDASGRARNLASTVAAASIAGLPPSFAFIGKLMLLRAALEVPGGGVLVGVLVVATVVLVGAATRMHLALGARAPVETPRSAMPVTLALVSVVLCAWPEPVARLVHSIGVDQLGGDR